MRKIIIPLLTVITAFNSVCLSCFAKDYQKALARVNGQGETVTVTVKLREPAKVFGYQCLISFDSQLLEFDGITKRYFPVSGAAEANNGTVYTAGEIPVGYEKIKEEEGKVYYLSTAVKDTVIKNRDEIIQLTFKSKAAGETFISFNDEKAMIEGNDTVIPAETFFTVNSPGINSTSLSYSDAAPVKERYDLSEAKCIKVNYTDGQVQLKIKNGRILCSVDNPFGGDVTPAVVQVAFDGTQRLIKTVYNDKTNGRLKFAVRDFGCYYIVPLTPFIADMNDDGRADIVKQFAAADIISGGGEINYRPYEKITRAEFIKLISCASDLVNNNAKCSYKDVSIADWFYTYAASMEAAGVLDKGEALFSPNSAVSGEEAAVLADRALNVETISKGEAYGNEITRIDAAQIIYDAFAEFFGEV